MLIELFDWELHSGTFLVSLEVRSCARTVPFPRRNIPVLKKPAPITVHINALYTTQIW
jgi:hypothetical protein